MNGVSLSSLVEHNALLGFWPHIINSRIPNFLSFCIPSSILYQGSFGIFTVLSVLPITFSRSLITLLAVSFSIT